MDIRDSVSKLFALCLMLCYAKGVFLDGHPNNANVSVCSDEVENCMILNLTLDLCKHVDNAKRICAQFCGLCQEGGVWSLWSDWSGCDFTCGGSTRSRSRVCNNVASANIDTSCSGSSQETHSCNLEPCPVKGGWGSWSAWGSCSATCDTGLMLRQRSCNNLTPTVYSDRCDGQNVDFLTCKQQSCAHWSSWSSWSSCSNTCGTGMMRRHRTCTGGQGCTGSDQDMSICQTTCLQHYHQTTSAFSAKDIVINSKHQARFNTIFLNEGGDYSYLTGVFTCRIPGLYFFTATLTKRRDTSRVDWVECNLYLNDNDKLKIFIDPTDDDTDKGSYSVTGSAVFHLRTHDTVRLETCESQSYFERFGNTFSGFLIKADQ